jgi:uncharacterized membrane protein YeaQ/YmgE (transglycosylase-associated protein family)
MSIIWTIIIGFVVGVIARFIMPGDRTEPKGFILTAILGIVGAFVATYLGQSVGWYQPENLQDSLVASSARSLCSLSMACSQVAKGAPTRAFCVPIESERKL